MACCIVTVLLMVFVRCSDGGCHVNDWPHSCEANFRTGPQRCERKVESTAYIGSNTRDVTSTSSLKSDKDELKILTIVGITTGTLLSIGVISNVLCFCFLCRRKSDSFTLEKGAKSTNGVLELGTNEENIDGHSYLTISDRSVRMYAAVHYDEAEEGKSSPSLSLHSEKEDPSIKCKTSPSLSLHSKKEEKNKH